MRLRRTKDLWQYTIGAINTDIGRVHDLYFDDETWTIRYIVVETGAFLPGRKVLISPAALQARPLEPASPLGQSHLAASFDQSQH